MGRFVAMVFACLVDWRTKVTTGFVTSELACKYHVPPDLSVAKSSTAKFHFPLEKVNSGFSNCFKQSLGCNTHASVIIHPKTSKAFTKIIFCVILSWVYELRNERDLPKNTSWIKVTALKKFSGSHPVVKSIIMDSHL